MDANFNDETNRNLITKKFHSYVKSKSNSHRIPELICYGTRLKSSRKEQCELFNEYFYDQFTEPSSYNIPIDFSNDHLFDIYFSPAHIATLLKDLDINKAQGPDEIHGHILKNCCDSLNVPLTILFQKSYNTGKIPHKWKLANVVPVHKKGSKADVENYRPISLISIVMKTYERVIRDELLSRCGHLIDSRQHGFVFEKSCNTQLVTFCDSLALSLNDNIRTNVVYFDFQKAFDSVNHDIILQKLKYQYNIDGKLLQFFVNYLSGRYQKVVIGNETSTSKAVTSGVPQGSIVGPTLFVLFINDITANLSPGTNISLYADDTKIWRRIKTQDDHWFLQSDINRLENWATTNKMKFHPDKTNILSVSNSNITENMFIYTIDSIPIEYTPCQKDLGIKITTKLLWTEHANFIYSRANQKLGLLKRTCNFVSNFRKRRNLYLTQVRSQFEHCPNIWRPSSITCLERLESIQKRGIKWILNDISISFSSIHKYLQTCKQLDILPISVRFDLKDLKFFHKIFYGFSVVKFPAYLFQFNGSRLRQCHFDSYSVCSKVQPRLPQNLASESTNIGISKSYFYRAHLLWNKLPISLRKIESPTMFESKLIIYLWDHAYENAHLLEPNDMEND